MPIWLFRADVVFNAWQYTKHRFCKVDYLQTYKGDYKQASVLAIKSGSNVSSWDPFKVCVLYIFQATPTSYFSKLSLGWRDSSET